MIKSTKPLIFNIPLTLKYRINVSLPPSYYRVDNLCWKMGGIISPDAPIEDFSCKCERRVVQKKNNKGSNER